MVISGEPKITIFLDHFKVIKNSSHGILCLLKEDADLRPPFPFIHLFFPVRVTPVSFYSIPLPVGKPTSAPLGTPGRVLPSTSNRHPNRRRSKLPPSTEERSSVSPYTSYGSSLRLVFTILPFLVSS